MIFLMLALLSLLAWLLPPSGARVTGMAAMPVAIAGATAALWQHFVAADSNSCAMSFADRVVSFTTLNVRWPELFEVRASCAEARAVLLGVSFEFWGLALLVLVMAIHVRGLLSSQRP